MDPTADSPRPEHFLSLVAPLRDEESYLIEFVAYYLIHGVDHFYFYDNESRVPVGDVLRGYRDRCTVLTAPGDAVQSRAYAHFCRHFRHETRWAAFFDIDEFVLPHRHGSFREFLRDYDDCDGIAVNWVMFGDGHHKTQPTGGVIENYLYREAAQSPWIKSVVKSERLAGFPDNPHFASLLEGSSYVDAHRKPVTSAYHESHTIDIIQLNHYFTKSAAEWNRKRERRRADSGRSRAEQDDGWVLTVNETLNQVRETAIVDRYGTRLAEALGRP